MTDRHKLIVLLVLIVVFIAVNLRDSISPAATSVPGRPQPGGRPSARIPDAEVMSDLPDGSAPSVVAEAKRNIFQYGQAAQSVGQRPKPTPVVDTTPPPPPPPPPPPVRFFGFAQASAGGARRVFLTSGEETFIVREGEIFMQRYRLARIGQENVEIEETSGKNRWVVPLEQQ
ncbi:MAG: hypothetical protein ACRD4U_05900 [Candidatus Acidiferrales bacterium]